MFDFNSINSISATDAECIFTYSVCAAFKLHGISTEGVDFSSIRTKIISDKMIDNRITFANFEKMCQHRLITEFLKLFRIPEPRILSLSKIKDAVSTISQFSGDVPIYQSIPWSRIFLFLI